MASSLSTNYQHLSFSIPLLSKSNNNVGSPISLSSNPNTCLRFFDNKHSSRFLSFSLLHDVASTLSQWLPPKQAGKSKKVVGMIKLALEAGKATPAPPVGPALGSKCVNIVAFCKIYNARTSDKACVIPVEITVYDF